MCHRAPLALGQGKVDRRQSFDHFSRLGTEVRAVATPQQFTLNVGVLRELRFTSLQQVDDCIDELDDAAISKAIWGSRRGQLARFEGLLLAGMGEYYIDHHPSRGIPHFVEIRRRWLDRLKEHSVSVHSYRPR